MNTRNIIVYITNNWPAKLLALVLSILLYIFHQGRSITTIRFEIPLTIISNNDLIPVADIPAKVRLTLSGKAEEINVLIEDDFTATLDLGIYDTPGDYNARVQLKNQSETAAIDTISGKLSPEEISITLDRREGRYFLIEPQLRGDVAPGYALVYEEVLPKHVFIEGPAAKIEALKSIGTEVIDITGRSESFTKNVRLSAVDSSLTVQENMVQYSANIKTIDTIEEYKEIPIEIKNLAPMFTAEQALPPGEASIQGNNALIAEWSPESGALSVDLSQIKKAGTYIVPVSISVPHEFNVLKYSPEKLSIKIINAAQ
ncbi:MAG: hypothetical protein Pg6A_17100 [Termitinemataceae bacterium]|jgi:YbbR domain-containing protein|nr:MAG: hypothetical protein Pg6A_17100 [Termitinemataceae bacterium]